MTSDNGVASKRHAVILSGGGANGAYEIGVMKALFGGHVKLGEDPTEGPVKIDPMVFTGTSVGSFNAAFMASRPGQAAATTLNELEELWRNRIAGTKTRWNGVFRLRGNVLELTDLNRLLVNPLTPPANFLKDAAFFAKDSISRAELFFRSKVEVMRRLVELVDFSTLISTEPLQDLVRETIKIEQIRTNKECALVIAATNWEKGETEVFTNPKAAVRTKYKVLDEKIGHLAILASAAIPGIFPTVEIYHTKYIDGGLLMNTPLSPAIHAGADVLHVIYLDPDLKDVPIDSAGGSLDMLNRLSTLAFAGQVNRDVKQARSINQVLDLHRQMAGVLKTTFGRDRIESLGLGSAADKIDKITEEALDEITRKQETYECTYGKQHRLRPITIHRYHPGSLLEGGVFGMLNFDSSRVSDLIHQGFEDAAEHNCIKCECIFPTIDKLHEVAVRTCIRKKDDEALGTALTSPVAEPTDSP
ncbi:MAG TPA: patatin-like phospholipase family protein [Acidobacteriota bacterium]